jgi:hypothetical protein
LDNGMDDESYKYVFEPIMQKVMEVYQPGAIVVCGGADSLSGDKLGCFNLSLQGHSACIEFLGKFGVPMLVLGGGGYTMRNVARCWCYETGRLLGLDLPDELPESTYEEYDYYMDTHRLRIAVSNMKNQNSLQDLDKKLAAVLQQIAELPAAPSAHMAVPPPKMEGAKEEDLPEEDMDVRGGGQAFEDRRVVKDQEGYGSDEEGGGRADVDHGAGDNHTGGNVAAGAGREGGDGGADVKVEANGMGVKIEGGGVSEANGVPREGPRAATPPVGGGNGNGNGGGGGGSGNDEAFLGGVGENVGDETQGETGDGANADVEAMEDDNGGGN